jgi:hypothetical protein
MSLMTVDILGFSLETMTSGGLLKFTVDMPEDTPADLKFYVQEEIDKLATQTLSRYNSES